jgi:hypothetical protein
VDGAGVDGGLGQTGCGAGGQTSASGARATASGFALGSGPLAQAASSVASSTPAVDDNDGTRDSEEKAVGWVFMEIVIALLIAVAIVWWTFPRKPRAEPPREESDREQR